MQGFSLHANTQVPAEQDANGDRVYPFTHLWSDGTTGMRLSPRERLEKLAALVPLPRVHLVR